MKQFLRSSMLVPLNMQRHLQTEERHIAILDSFFFNAFDYLRANEVEGDYLEFGCGAQVISFRLAAKYRSMIEHKPCLYAFDSFRGLPPPKENDPHPGWIEGGMAVSQEDFAELMIASGLKDGEFKTIEGFYDRSLEGRKPREYGIKKAAFAFIDCDYYSSTVPVLKFLSFSLSDGAIIAFDDWNCYKADPSKGQRRALGEFAKKMPHLQFEPFLSWGWHGQSFIVRSSLQESDNVSLEQLTP